MVSRVRDRRICRIEVPERECAPLQLWVRERRLVCTDELDAWGRSLRLSTRPRLAPARRHSCESSATSLIARFVAFTAAPPAAAVAGKRVGPESLASFSPSRGVGHVLTLTSPQPLLKIAGR
jgi:hypothetical protein